MSRRSSDYEDIEETSLEHPEETATKETDVAQREDDTQEKDVFSGQNLTEGQKVALVDDLSRCATLEECTVEKSNISRAEGDVTDNVQVTQLANMQYTHAEQ